MVPAQRRQNYDRNMNDRNMPVSTQEEKKMVEKKMNHIFFSPNRLFLLDTDILLYLPHQGRILPHKSDKMRHLNAFFAGSDQMNAVEAMPAGKTIAAAALAASRGPAGPPFTAGFSE
jgi:hypothetical protein